MSEHDHVEGRQRTTTVHAEAERRGASRVVGKHTLTSHQTDARIDARSVAGQVIPATHGPVAATRKRGVPELIRARTYIDVWAEELLEGVWWNAGQSGLPQPHARAAWNESPVFIANQLAIWANIDVVGNPRF